MTSRYVLNDMITNIGMPKFKSATLSDIARACENYRTETEDILNAETSFMFAQANGVVNQNWVLLDSQATCNVITNRKMLSNVRKHPQGKIIHIHCNAGTVTVSEIGTLEGFGPVWFFPDGIANVLSLALVSDQFQVTLDTEISQAFYVHRGNGTTRRFDRMECNLYACDLSARDETVLNITTVEGQMKSYSDLDIRRAKKARKLQETLGFPSTKALIKMVDKNQIKNCPITRQDILIADDMFGTNTNIVKGKTVRRKPGHVREDIQDVPPDILKNYRNVTLGIDIFHVNGLKFFRSISRHLMYRTSSCVQNANKGTLLQCVRAIKGRYNRRGFKITQIFGDNEFECMSDSLSEMGITFSAVARGAHEPFIERDNRTSKERARCIFASIPFKRIPPRMTIEMVYAVDFWLNSWCSSGGGIQSHPSTRNHERYQMRCCEARQVPVWRLRAITQRV